MLNPNELDWNKMDGLIPAIVQDVFDGRVLMQAYVNREALEQTQTSGLATFWSRSRGKLWRKGESSGNTMKVESLHADCDGDCLLILVEPAGPACHLGLDTCFDGTRPVAPLMAFLSQLETIIADRDAQPRKGSYTSSLLEAGVNRIAQKVGEEGVETALAAVGGSDQELLDEAADLLYHLMVLLRSRKIDLAALCQTLHGRHASTR